MVRVFFLQLLKEQINSIFEVFIVLSCFTCINHINQHGEILFFLRCFVPDVCNQCCIIEFFCFDPKVLTGLLPLSFCVDYDCVDEFQNVLFAPQISKWIIMHGFCKVYGVEDFNLILAPLQHLPTFH